MLEPGSSAEMRVQKPGDEEQEQDLKATLWHRRWKLVLLEQNRECWLWETGSF